MTPTVEDLVLLLRDLNDRSGVDEAIHECRPYMDYEQVELLDWALHDWAPAERNHP